jgi:small GTP-binding protein
MGDNSNKNFNYSFKYIIIGDAAVGKSNLLIRYVYGEFNKDYQNTIGVEFGVKNINIKNKICRIQIWDTAGQETFKSITKGYYKNSVCAIIVYDITRRDSFNNINTWINDCKTICSKTVSMVLVGAKSDLEINRQVMKEEGEELAEKNGIPFYETSAKTGENVNEVFFKSAEEIVEKINKGFYDLDDENCGIKLGPSETKKNINKVEDLKNNQEIKKQKKCC